MTAETESIGDYDARNAAGLGKVCGDLSTARWHLRRGLKPSELDERCSAAYRAYHRSNGALPNRARQRALSAVKDLYPWQYEQIRLRHRWDVEFELATSGEDATLKQAANRARQRAMVELSNRHWDDYQRLRAEILDDLLGEMFDGDHR